MDDIYVGRLMTSSPVTVGPDALVEEAADTLLSHDIGSLLVTDDDGRLLGILTTTDFVAIVAESKPKAETSVERHMSTDVVTTTARTPIRDVADEMLDRGVHHMPVVDDGDAVGIISTTDMTGYITNL